ncbi:hypothetical protein OH76DRAFT_568963 [Lentinus brumalis]|uniref:C2H2-type domain-containing protein n=1 Tax=Lentinus brumalis TaxID=2498619 RepID=A0A371DTH1_9APHY|nr:hypothetical protein OH76DRAFT_568963 [Polyporus brumalis]
MKRSQCKQHAATCGHVATTKATRHPLYATAAYWSWAEFQARVRDVAPGSDFTPVSTPSPSLGLSPSGPPISQLIACSKCHELFPDAYALHMHRQLGHSDLVTHAGGGTDLHAEPTSDDVRDEHGQRHLDVELEETACSAATFNTETVQETCYICGIAFSDEVALDAHLASTFSCMVCAVHHASVEALQEHYQRELKLHPQCRACGLAFDGIPAWARHRALCRPTTPAADDASALSCDDIVQVDASGTIAGSHAIPQSVNAETYSYHDYTTDGRPQLIPPLGEDELSSSQGGSDRGQVNSELVSTLTVSASISVPHRGWDERVIAAGIHRPYSVIGSAIPNISPNPVRCNQCKLVCKNVGELQWHAKQTGHTHKPMYFCPVCLVTLPRLKDKRSHIRTTGHYTASPAFRHSLSADLSSATPATSFASPGPNTTRRIDLTRHSHCPPQLQHHFLESLLTTPTSFHSPASMSIPKDQCSAPKSFLGPAEHFLRASAHATAAPPPNFPGPSIRKQIVPSTAVRN